MSTLDETSGRPDLDQDMFWDQILQLISERLVVPVLGRDVLKISHQGSNTLLYPLLARHLAEYLSVSDAELPIGDELNTVACRYKRDGNRIEDIYAALKSVMPIVDQLSIPTPLRQLAEIRPLKLFVTTTFDPLLARALNQVRYSDQPRTKILNYTPSRGDDLPRALEQLEDPVVYHLFGKLSAIPAFAVTQEDLLEWLHALQSENRQPPLLFDALDRSSLLLLGCGFDNWLARFFIRAAKRERLIESYGKTDYVADEAVRGDSDLVVFLDKFSANTKVYSGGGALEFVDELSRRWRIWQNKSTSVSTISNASRRRAEGLDKGTVFLSYASEDLEAARRICLALEAAGVDVFFDKEALRAGEDFEVRLARSIHECAVFLPLISANTLKAERRFFRLEWSHALEEALKAPPMARFIIPTVIDDTHPESSALPERYGKLQWENAPDGNATPEFVNLIKQLFRAYQRTIASNQ